MTTVPGVTLVYTLKLILYSATEFMHCARILHVWEKVRALLEIYLRNENASVPFQKSEPSLSMFAIRPKAYTDQTVAIVVVIVVAVVAAVVAAVVKNPFHAFRPTGYMVLIPII